MAVDNVGVHQTHCCRFHGCKYGDDDCPVAAGEVVQEYGCETCAERAEEVARQMGLKYDYRFGLTVNEKAFGVASRTSSFFCKNADGSLVQYDMVCIETLGPLTTSG